MTVLIDTSAWIEYLRKTGSDQDLAVESLGAPTKTFSTCGPVTMELFAGARDAGARETIDKLLGWGSDIPCNRKHFDDAAVIYRLCRESGVTVRSMIDCLISALALSHDVELLHHDRDFNAIAGVVPLRIHPESLAD